MSMTPTSRPPSPITPAPKPKVPGGFVKGDPRINKLGRPRASTALREYVLDWLAQKDDGTSRTRLESIIRRLAVKNPEVLLQYAYGKPTQRVEHAGIGAVLVLHAHQNQHHENSPAIVTRETD